MERNKVDAFLVCVGCEYYSNPEEYLQVGDYVCITSKNTVLKNGKQMGSIALQEKYYDRAVDLLDIMTSQNTLQLKGDEYAILERADIIKYFGANVDIEGIVQYCDDKIALLYVGTFDEEELFPEVECDFDDDIEKDEVYALTERALQMLRNITADVNCKRKEEEKTMNNVFGNLGFGKLNDSRFSLSMNGIAVRQSNTGKYVVYNKENNEFVDATDLLFNIKDALFVLPAMEIKAGDTVLHEGKPYFIVDTTNEIKAVSYEDCTQTVLIPKTTMFGLKYFTKVFSVFGDNFASTGELFSNPMMLMALINGDANNDTSKLLLLSSLSKGDIASNPMLMATLLKGEDKLDLSTVMMMSMMNGNNNPFTPKKNKTANKE